MTKDYVHGYESREVQRLQDQATTLVDLLHADTFYPSGTVLEAGCGVGAQTVTLAAQGPNAHITSIDVSDESLAKARKRVDAMELSNVTLQQADIFQLLPLQLSLGVCRVTNGFNVIAVRVEDKRCIVMGVPLAPRSP